MVRGDHPFKTNTIDKSLTKGYAHVVDNCVDHVRVPWSRSKPGTKSSVEGAQTERLPTVSERKAFHKLRGTLELSFYPSFFLLVDRFDFLHDDRQDGWITG